MGTMLYLEIHLKNSSSNVQEVDLDEVIGKGIWIQYLERDGHVFIDSSATHDLRYNANNYNTRQ